MTSRTDAIAAGRTREMRWHEVPRAALILGVVPDYSKESMLKVAGMVQAGVDADRVFKRKDGEHQAAAAYYSAKLRGEEEEDDDRDRDPGLAGNDDVPRA
jgi:hypothetical protein